MLSPHLILPVKTRIILRSLDKVCKQTTFRNIKRDNDCRENTAISVLVQFTVIKHLCTDSMVNKQALQTITNNLNQKLKLKLHAQ